MTYHSDVTAAADSAPLDADARDSLNFNPPRSRFDDLSMVRLGLQARALRGRYFNSNMFSDPAWDILLELYVANLVERRLSVARLSERAGIPATTTLRWVTTLEHEGLIDKHENQFDRRQVLLSLSKRGRHAMASFFEGLDAETRLF